MGVVIRNMLVDDLVDVKRADLMSWTDMMERQYAPRPDLQPRTDANLLSYLQSDPQGAFVAADEFAGVVGMSFSHVWGTTGWVGPLSVLPSYQARGIGKDLLKRSFSYLEDQGCVDIGLETMPENQTNLGMYLKVGLRTEGLLLIFGKKLNNDSLQEEAAGEVSVQRYSESDSKPKVDNEMRRISNALRLGLDYTKETRLTEEFDFGETMIASTKDEIVGFAVVHTKGKREQLNEASVRLLCVDPAAEQDVIEPLLIASELLAADAGCPYITAPVGASCKLGVNILFSRDYSIFRSLERLMWLGESGLNDRSFNLATWSG